MSTNLEISGENITIDDKETPESVTSTTNDDKKLNAVTSSNDTQDLNTNTAKIAKTNEQDMEKDKILCHLRTRISLIDNQLINHQLQIVFSKIVVTILQQLKMTMLIER